MEIGDRVRILHGKEEGIIRRFIDNKTVEIEIEDGFLIPVLKKELVGIAREESEKFRNEAIAVIYSSDKDILDVSTDQPEITLAIETKNQEINIWLINNTADSIMFAAHAILSDGVIGLSHGTLREYTYSKLETWKLKDQDIWPPLWIDIISFRNKAKDHIVPISKKIHISKNHLLKKKVKAPLIKIDSALISLSHDIDVIKPNEIKEALFSNTLQEKQRKDSSENNTDMIVDLHIASLIKNPAGLGNQEILDIQSAQFEKKLDLAIINNASSITFIHGVGNGTLRHLIHKFLSQYPHIKYYEDAQKEKFGYGATKVILK